MCGRRRPKHTLPAAHWLCCASGPVPPQAGWLAGLASVCTGWLLAKTRSARDIASSSTWTACTDRYPACRQGRSAPGPSASRTIARSHQNVDPATSAGRGFRSTGRITKEHNELDASIIFAGIIMAFVFRLDMG